MFWPKDALQKYVLLLDKAMVPTILAVPKFLMVQQLAQDRMLDFLLTEPQCPPTNTCIGPRTSLLTCRGAE
jgi:hypothetical protein